VSEKEKSQGDENILSTKPY